MAPDQDEKRNEDAEHKTDAQPAGGVGCATVAHLDLPAALSDAAHRWPDWDMPTADVTIEDVARWGKQAGAAVADGLIRWIKFGLVYATLVDASKKPFRDAWGHGMSRTYACDAARCSTYLLEVCQGRVPADIEGPRDLIAVERDHRLASEKTAREAAKAERERNARVEAEQQAEYDEDNPRPDDDANPDDDEPVLHHVLWLKTWLTEHPDAAVPVAVVVQVRALLADLEARGASDANQIKPNPTGAVQPQPVDQPLVPDVGAAHQATTEALVRQHTPRYASRARTIESIGKATALGPEVVKHVLSGVGAIETDGKWHLPTEVRNPP